MIIGPFPTFQIQEFIANRAKRIENDRVSFQFEQSLKQRLREGFSSLFFE
jgi:hypothetical protein